MGGHGFRGSRMLGGADLQLVILALLAEKPRHGYEIIKATQERSLGFYSPSPGMVYPALTYLEEVGHATVELSGTKKLYSLTESGRQQVEEHKERIATVFSELARIGQKMQRARHAFDTDAAPASESVRAFDEVRRDLKAAIFDAFDASADEQARVAGILARAIAEIRRR
jgi:DNA-binding PadR family transcriptional regulator